MFLEYKEELKKPRPQIVEPEPEEIDAGNAGGGLGALGGLLGGLMGGAAAGGAENAEAEEVHDETKVVDMKPNTENNAE
jgi:predicted lipid-binding transport protein (Tim44 family)